MENFVILQGKIGDSLQIPKDLSYGESVLTLTGSRESGHRKL